ncbi:MAG: oligosaccharide flippase family protein [Flavobacteriales bacterium]|jgi:O-antigen/teichoic acid export membrane protein|nr:oligosaccharide flippase family protein [Flavobacteriales bacterium]
MNKVISESLKSSGIFYLAAIFGVVNRLFLLPKALTPQEFGFMETFITIATLFSAIAGIGISQIFVKFHQGFSDNNRFSVFSNKLFQYMLLAILLVGTLAYLGKDFVINFYKKADDIQLLDKFYVPILLYGGLMVIRSYYNSYAAIQKKIAITTFFEDFWEKSVRLILLMVLSCCYIAFDHFVFLIVFSYLAATFFVISYLWKKFHFRPFPQKEKLTKTEHKTIWMYGGFMLLTGLNGQITKMLDNIMIGNQLEFAYVALYSIPLFMGKAIEMPKRALSSIATPIISSHFEKNDLKKIQTIYKQSSINQGLVALLFFLLLLINLDLIYELIPNKDIYIAGKNVAIIIGATTVLDMFMGVNYEIVYASKYYRYGLLALFVLIFIGIYSNHYFITVYQFGIMGAAYATLLTVFLMNLFMTILLYSLFRIHAFSIKNFYLILIFGLTLFIRELFPNIPLDHFWQLTFWSILETLVCISIFVFAVWKLNVSEEFNSLLKMAIEKLRKLIYKT